MGPEKNAKQIPGCGWSLVRHPAFRGCFDDTEKEANCDSRFQGPSGRLPGAAASHPMKHPSSCPAAADGGLSNGCALMWRQGLPARLPQNARVSSNLANSAHGI